MSNKLELKNFLTQPEQIAICLLLIVEQLEIYDTFATKEGYEKFSEKEIIFLRKQGRYPLLLPVFFLMKEELEKNKKINIDNKKDWEVISQVISDLSQITDGICMSQNNNLEDSRKSEKEYLQKCRKDLEEILSI